MRGLDNWAWRVRVLELPEDHDLHAEGIEEIVVLQIRLVKHLNRPLSAFVLDLGHSRIDSRLGTGTELSLHLVALVNRRHRDIGEQLHALLHVRGQLRSATAQGN